MRKTIIGAATIALLSTTALVSAQQSQEPQKEPSAKQQGQAPGGKSGTSAQSGSEKGDRNGQAAQSKDRAGDTKRSAQDKAGDTKRSAQDKAGDTKRSAQDKAGDTKRAAQDKADDTKRSAQDKAGDTKRSAKDKAGDTKRTAKDKAGDTKDRDQARGKDGDRDRDQARGKDADRDRDQARAKDGDRNRVNLTQNQRTEVREKLSRHREARVTNVNFSINVGTRVPRDFRLYTVPADIIAIVPAYRGYRYFIVDERVVIVHPQRHEIVEVIEVGGPRRGGSTSASLELSQPQIALILDHVDDRRISNVNVDLALGAEVPSSVELYEFPALIVDEVPSVRQYRYVVLDRRVLIVDPSGRDVVRVIDRK